MHVTHMQVYIYIPIQYK